MLKSRTCGHQCLLPFLPLSPTVNTSNNHMQHHRVALGQPEWMRVAVGTEPTGIGGSVCPEQGCLGPGTYLSEGEAGPLTTLKRFCSNCSSQYRSQNFSDMAPQKVAKVRSFKA